jgi:hypothetical protein
MKTTTTFFMSTIVSVPKKGKSTLIPGFGEHLRVFLCAHDGAASIGQGTFGQVVKCQNMKTHEIVAVKVVKNKPAYFNQSMMEVTILELVSTSLFCAPWQRLTNICELG